MNCILVSEINFSAAHFYSQPVWSFAENKKRFGKCFSDKGHGHDYRLEVGILHREDNDLKDLEKAMFELREEIDHKHLNFEIPPFDKEIPTTENLALFCAARMQRLSPGLQLHHLRLFETPDLWVEVVLSE